MRPLSRIALECPVCIRVCGGEVRVEVPPYINEHIGVSRIVLESVIGRVYTRDLGKPITHRMALPPTHSCKSHALILQGLLLPLHVVPPAFLHFFRTLFHIREERRATLNRDRVSIPLFLTFDDLWVASDLVYYMCAVPFPQV